MESILSEEDFVSVHIRVVGDWTGKLEKLLNPDRTLGVGRNTNRSIRDQQLDPFNGRNVP